MTTQVRAGSARRAYLGLFAQLLTSQVVQQVSTQILTHGTCQEGGRAGPEGDQALGPGFPAQGPHGQVHWSLQRRARKVQAGGRLSHGALRPPEGARALAPTPLRDYSHPRASLQTPAAHVHSSTPADTPRPSPEMKQDSGVPPGRDTRGGGAGRPPARGACRELIRPPSGGRHRNHSAAPAPGARGNGPAALT